MITVMYYNNADVRCMRQLLDSRFVTPASNIDIDIDDIGDNDRLIEVPLIDPAIPSNVSQSHQDTSESTLRCNDMRFVRCIDVVIIITICMSHSILCTWWCGE